MTIPKFNQHLTKMAEAVMHLEKAHTWVYIRDTTIP